MLFSFFISSIVLKIENKSTVFKYEGNQKLKVKSESAAYIKFKSNLICTYYANNQQCVYLNWCQMEWTDGRWLHPCYPKCIKFVSKMKANLSLTQRDGSIHVIQNVSNCFPKWKQILALPKEMAPGSLWIGNVKVNVVHVLVRDRARIKLERKKNESFSLSCCSMDPVQWVNGQWILSGSLLKMLS